jgi:hypothetical protein
MPLYRAGRLDVSQKTTAICIVGERAGGFGEAHVSPTRERSRRASSGMPALLTLESASGPAR